MSNCIMFQHFPFPVTPLKYILVQQISVKKQLIKTTANLTSANLIY